ncbi:hypothetical protein [Vreelandella populi]|uniref:hypothetical protein n=1 Tax=Vreelandella populi TaxID=2498858 RepID=UPI000F8E9E53|nr:hypothetical protein [Halomonas populi]RUR52954.1 hypothetical protein ELY40_13010 [Halomonas populi]
MAKFDYNKGAFWLGVITLIAGLLVAYVSTQNNWEIAEQSGAFDRPEVQLMLNTEPLEPYTPIKILFGAPQISDASNVAISTLPLIIRNSGNRSLEEASLTFRFHKIFTRSALESLEYSMVGGVQASRVERNFSQSGVTDYSSYLIPLINPGELAMISEPLYLPNMKLDVPFEASTSDDVKISANLGIELAWKFEASLAARDIVSRSYQFELSTAVSNSLEELTQHAVSEINNRLEEVRHRMNFFEYLNALVFGIDSERVHLVFNNLDDYVVPGKGMLWFSHSDPGLREIYYRPVSWRLLF